MGTTILYKYLDYNGGLMMLTNSNLQFTNATKFNDPFDCHPALFDYSKTPTNERNWPPADFISSMGENRMENHRNDTWICSLSKVYDSLLMWAYYNGHKGICIGLNKEAVLKCLQNGFYGHVIPFDAEVKYKDISHKLDYFKDYNSWTDLLTIKAKDWAHEKEVRLITIEPAWIRAGRDIPEEFKKEELVDWKEVRHYPQLTGDCFESLFLGIKMDSDKKEQIIEAARKLNPKIKIYQMKTDFKAFKLKEEKIER
ncbi:MAG: DUF2971 domain-containing protein [Paludibacteraceae bacterium]|nr:DUF2971 domain-containing protein [Paludibacteraceae bacterium]